MRPLRASALARIEACPGSQTLPHADTAGPAAERGRAIHAFLQRVNDGHPDPLADVPEEYQAFCSLLDASQFTTATAEMDYAVRPDTGESVLGERRPGEPGWISGTIDIAGVLADGETGYVGDYKTGAVPVAAEGNLQLGAAAIAVSAWFGLKVVRAEIIQLDFLGRPHVRQWVLRATDLMAMRTRLQGVLARVAAASASGGVPDVREGEWCKYCPAVPHCPAKMQLARELANLRPGEPLTRETAGRAWQRLRAARQILHGVEKAIYALAQEGPIPLGGGVALRYVTRSGNERIDGDKAVSLLTEAFGADFADACSQKTVTKTAIRSAARSLPGRTLADSYDRVLDVLRAAGAVSRPMTEKLEEVPE